MSEQLNAPDLVAQINDLRRRVYELERRRLPAGTAPPPTGASPIFMIADAASSTADELAQASYTVAAGADAGAVFNAAFADHPGGTFLLASGLYSCSTFWDCYQGGSGRIHIIGQTSVSGEFTLPLHACRVKFNIGSNFTADHASASIKVGYFLTLENLSLESFSGVRACFAAGVASGQVNLTNVFLDNWDRIFDTTGSGANDCGSYGHFTNVSYSPQNTGSSRWSQTTVDRASLVNVWGNGEGGSNSVFGTGTTFTNSALTNVYGINYTDGGGNHVVDATVGVPPAGNAAGDLTGTYPNPTVRGVAAAALDIKIGTVGKGYYVKEGTNATMGVATLVAGTVVVSTNKVTASSRIHLTVQSLGTVTAPKAVAVTARTAATSFTITSADNTDTSVVGWQIIEPA